MEADEFGVDVLDFADSVKTGRGKPLIGYLIVIEVDIIDLVDISGGLADSEGILFTSFSRKSLIRLCWEPARGDYESWVGTFGEIQDRLFCTAGLDHILVGLSEYAGVVCGVPILECDNVCSLLRFWLSFFFLTKTLSNSFIF